MSLLENKIIEEGFFNDESDGGITSSIQKVDEIAREMKNQIIISAYTKRIRTIKLDSRWRSDWLKNLESWISQINIVSIYDEGNYRWRGIGMQVVIQILPDVRFEFHVDNFNSVNVYHFEKNLLTLSKDSDYLEKLVILYRLFPLKYTAPFNIWMDAICKLLKIFHLWIFTKHPGESWNRGGEIAPLGKEEDKLENFWCLRSIDFHPACRDFFATSDDSWTTIKWSVPIFDINIRWHVARAINSAIIAHTVTLGFSRHQLFSGTGVELWKWKKFVSGLSFHPRSSDQENIEATIFIDCDDSQTELQLQIVRHPRKVKCWPGSLKIIHDGSLLIQTEFNERDKKVRLVDDNKLVAGNLILLEWTILSALEIYFSCLLPTDKELNDPLDDRESLRPVLDEETAFACTTLGVKWKEKKKLKNLLVTSYYFLPK